MATRLTIISIQWLMAATLIASSAAAAEWMLTGQIQAPEAIQAAAVDERFIFAINNTQIAKYDRQSEKRLAVSQGEAQHLNSGFLMQGRLYCAHSNYPKVPESSQIKVLDTASMTLTTYRDFYDYGGSLTWCVHRDGYWWCCFAKYGELNRQTFVAKFDEQWKEVSRWTLPEELVSQMGRYSLSGGLWYEDSMLVTGHDDRILFRLKIPETGNVLELVEKIPAPFTGQGIAIDSATHGLVGIDRVKRLVLFARPALAR